MAKFLSHDGVDKQGVRAEVMVQTGTGRIKEIIGRGSSKPDGSYRNVEVVFDPDNPKLQRKVYALLDTTSTELWEYVQEAHLSGKDISYRIESQRRRNVDRHLKFEDLVHAEQVVRVLAAIDDKFSHEAKTSPAEDPESDAPSALYDGAENSTRAGTVNSVVGSSASLIQAIAQARTHGMSETTVDALVALALSQGASIEDVSSAGYEGASASSAREFVAGRSRAVEEKPWNATNTDGRINPGSYAVAHAATAERFALDHLVMLYSEGKKTKVTVSDEMISQAASLAIEILNCADDVQQYVVGRIDRQKNSYNRALSLILESIEKRHFAPIGGNSEAISDWRDAITTESRERFIGVLYVAAGVAPTVEHLTEWIPGQEFTNVKASLEGETVKTVGAPSDTTKTEPPVASATQVEQESSLDVQQILADSLGASLVENAQSVQLPMEGELGFVEPDASTIEALRNICVEAGVTDNPKAISDWLEANLGVRSARKAHATAVEAFVSEQSEKSVSEIRAAILGGDIASVA